MTRQPDRRHVLIAPDKFRGSLRAIEAAAAVAGGVRSVAPRATVACLPVADGGDGTLDAAVAAGFTRIPLTASGPLGEPVRTCYARRDETAVVELADVCGLTRMPAGTTDPLAASSAGVGQVLATVLDAGVSRIVLGIGGSASTDGGAGMLQALGAHIADRAGRDVRRGGAALADAAVLDLGPLRRRLGDVELLVAADVNSPLLGPSGAAAVYAPQKGAVPAQVNELDAALRRWAKVAGTAVGRDLADAPGAGAGGGAGFAALLLGARLRPGVDVVLELVGFGEAVCQTDLLITGEGSLDAQTLAGKAPLGVARAAGVAGVPVVAVAGRCLLSANEVAAAGFAAVYPLSDLEPDLARSMADATALLRRVGARIAGDWLTR